MPLRRFHFIRNEAESISRLASPAPQPELSLIAPLYNSKERHAFRYFIQQAAPVLAGAVDGGFWQDLVPRLSHTYNFVWNTVVCISSLMEHVPYISPLSESPVRVISQEHQQALGLYNKAITNVRQLLEHDQVDDSLVVLSYILFSTAEFHQGNVKTGNDLLQKCSNVLTKLLTLSHVGRNSAADQAIYQVVTPFVMRRAAVVSTLREAIRPQWATNDDVSNILTTISSTLNEARVEFHILANHSYEIIRLADIVLNVKAEIPKKAFLSQHQPLLDRLVIWRCSLIAAKSQIPSVQEEWVVSYLLMNWAVCYTSLAVCLSHRETNFDEYMDCFTQIIENATNCLRSRFTKVQSLSSLEHTVVAPLYFCATKCRDPALRRDALHLIRQAPRVKLWGNIEPDRVVAKMISVEEGDHGELPEFQCGDLPPEERRIAYVSVVGLRAPGDRQRQALELGRIEYANDGSTRLITGYTWLDDGENRGLV